MRCILAVSGTLQEGFPLRKNLDAPGAPAVNLGSGLVRGVRSYLDVKERGCREEGNAPNPACVVTGDAADGNVYELYLVDGAACLGALLGEPRYLAMAPDAVVLDLDAAETCDAVRRLARHVLGDASARRCSVLAVVSAAPAQPSFVRTPSDRSDGVTAFASGAALARERGLLAPTSGAANAWLGGRGARLNARLSDADAAAALAAAGLAEAAAALEEAKRAQFRAALDEQVAFKKRAEAERKRRESLEASGVDPDREPAARRSGDARVDRANSHSHHSHLASPPRETMRGVPRRGVRPAVRERLVEEVGLVEARDHRREPAAPAVALFQHDEAHGRCCVVFVRALRR